MAKKQKEMVQVQATANVAAPAAKHNIDTRPPPPARKCRDIPFCILFIFHLVLAIILAGFSIKYGDLNRIRYGTDFLNNTCGTLNYATPASNDNTGSETTDAAKELAGNASSILITNGDATEIPEFNLIQKPNVAYLFSPETIQNLQQITPNNLKAEFKASIRICVEKCPKENEYICLYGVSLKTTEAEIMQQLIKGECFLNPYNTKDILNRCIPIDLLASTAKNVIPEGSTLGKVGKIVATDLNSGTTAVTFAQSLRQTWFVVLAAAVGALALSFVWLLLLAIFARLLVWFTVITGVLGSGAGAGFFWFNWYSFKNTGTVIKTGADIVDSNVYNEKTLLILAIALTFVFLITLLVVIACRKRMKLAIVLLREASRSIRSMPMLILLPVFKNIAILGLGAVYIVVFALLSTSGSVIGAKTIANADQITKSTVFSKKIEPSSLLIYMQFYWLFSFFWNWMFLLGVFQTTVAGAVAAWYWSPKKSASCCSAPILASFSRCFRYSLGSIAFGSLLIALVKLIRAILIYAKKKLTGVESKFAKYILSCLMCCFLILEKLLKILTRRAYIEIAVYGYSFCTAARHATELIVRNAFRLLVIDGVSNFVTFLGKIFISGLCAVGAVIYIENTVPKEETTLTFYALPVIFIFVLSWIIASLFVAVVDMTLDTIFICFCEDSERNDGSSERPYHMSKSLQKFTEKYTRPAADIQK